MPVIDHSLAPPDVVVPHPLDRSRLDGLADHLEATIATLPMDACDAPPYIVHHRLRAGDARRVVLFQQPTALFRQPCQFVAFFGVRRAQCAQHVIDAVTAADESLMDALIRSPHLLSYTSIELGDQQWGNLVLFRDAAALAVVHQHEAHQHAAHVLAAQYYTQIRLYHGTLVQGIAATHRQFRFAHARTYQFGVDHASNTHAASRGHTALPAAL